MADARGRNNRAYVRNNRAVRDSLPPYCSWCGDKVDLTLPPTDRMSWTTDHTVELHQGGDLYGDRTLMHRACNSQKRMHVNRPPLQTTEEW
jgi:hypothetical protein